MKAISIIIPVYNEAKTLKKIIDKVIKVKLPNNIQKEIMIIDDGSSDASPQIIDELDKKYKNIKKVHNKKNIGKSQTVKRGLEKSTGNYVIIQDADLEYNPEDIRILLEHTIKNNLDVVYGNRFGKKSKIIYWQNYLGNRLLSSISNIFTYPRIKVWIPDMEVCYKLIRGEIAREIAQNLKAKSNFGFEPEITAKLSKYTTNNSHLKFGIIPISYFPRSISEGKKMKAIKDGLLALKEILLFNIFK